MVALTAVNYRGVEKTAGLTRAIVALVEISPGMDLPTVRVVSVYSQLATGTRESASQRPSR